jgi:hypothetical protein
MFLTLNGLVLKKMLLNVFFTTFSMVVNQQIADTCLIKNEDTHFLKTPRTEVPPRPNVGFRQLNQSEEFSENYFFYFKNSPNPIPKRGCLR